jgi:hypothetical protein
MVNMPEISVGVRKHGDFLLLTKTGRGRNVLRHMHLVGKEEEKSGNVTLPGSPDTMTLHFPDMQVLTPSQRTLPRAQGLCNRD